MTVDEINTVRDRLLAKMLPTGEHGLAPYSRGFAAGIRALAKELTTGPRPLLRDREAAS